MSQIEREFMEFDKNRTWPMIYQEIKNEASFASIEQEYSVKEARKPENRGKNRYRDVSPYDHSRVILQGGPSDYINASRIDAPESNRRYILSQGPLEHTSGHFWQMIWEQNTKGVIMLNKVIEKGAMKCHPYWPSGEEGEDDLVFEETKLKVTLLEEEDNMYFIVRTLDLENLETKESREVLHFHYTKWPDFGVPSSPHAFLQFLEAVRGQGVLENDVGPAVIHCSAGIGRSGTFCLVDTALLLVEKTKGLDEIDVKSLLLSMRSYRMGLIQTPEQLRFSYLAIIEGGRRMVLSDDPQDVNDIIEEYMDMTGGNKDKDEPPPPPHRTSSLSPTKRQQPPPPPPRRSNPAETEDLENEPPSKTNKLDDKHDNMSPVKPPRVGRTEMNKNLGENIARDKTFMENNNPVHDELDDSQSESFTQESNSPPHPESTSGSEMELRRRRREERKQKTQEMIEKMKEKQRHSETWKKRKSYMKPIAIGLTLLIGGLLLYKIYF